MAVRPSRLTERDFEDGISRTPWAVVRIDRTSPTFHPGLAETLDARWPELFTFATLSRAELRDPRFLDHVLQSAVGRIRGGVGDGYWLFAAGLAVSHHAGIPRPSNVSYAQESATDDLRDRITAKSGPRADPRDVETVRQVLEVFEPIIERRQQAWTGGSTGWSTSPPPPPPRSSAASAPSPSPDDPYVLLGIAETATLDEIKAAFKEQMKLNHPDKVAHLSPALQAFAQAQVLRIKDAYERLAKRR
jgi:DnaJ-domain-containing protein 1